MTIDEYTLIADLFGKRRSETRPAESRTSTIVGVATSDSEDGSVKVRLNGDVTGGEDGEVVIPTEAHIVKGDVVSVSLVGGTAKAPRVTGTVGGGDRIYASLVETNQLVATKADITDLTAAEGRIGTLEANALTASSAVITDLQADTAKVHDLTANELSAATGYVGDLVAGNLTAANLISDHQTIGSLDVSQISADHATIASLDSNYAQIDLANIANGTIKTAMIDDGQITSAKILNGTIANADIANGTIENAKIKDGTIESAKIKDGTIQNADIANGTIETAKIHDGAITNAKIADATIDSAKITNLTGANGWIDRLMVQTGLIANDGTVFTLDAIKVNAASITAGTIDIERIVVTDSQTGDKHMVTWDSENEEWDAVKLDGDVLGDRTIAADKIVAHDITVQEITTENLVGTGGWINLAAGTFQYVNATSGDGISWDGTNLTVNAASLDLKMSQSAQPNLAPLGATPFSDVYNSTSNPSGYWKYDLSTSWYTQLEDGWVHAYRDNRSGTDDAATTTWRPRPCKAIVPGQTYTILVEVRKNNSVAGESAASDADIDFYLQQIANNQFWGNGALDGATTSVKLKTGGASFVKRCYKVADTDHLSTDPVEMFRYNLRCDKGCLLDFEFRQSVYEGVYDGPYKPYTGSMLNASKADLKVQADRIGMVVSNQDASSSLQLTADAMTYIGNNVVIKDSTGSSTVITGGKLYTNLISVGDLSDGSSYSTTSQMNTAIGNAVDNIDVGGRNLILGTADAISTSDKLTTLSISTAANELASDDDVTLTFYASASESIWIDFYWCTTSGSTWNPFYPAFNLTTDRTRYSVTLKAGGSAANATSIRLRKSTSSHGSSSATGAIHVDSLKLERGNVATDWTPAPEDIQAEALDAEQQIYIQASSVSNAPTVPSAWVEESGESISYGTQGDASTITCAWTLKHPTYNRDRPVTFVATQRKRLDGTITCSNPLPDDTDTVIDGGRIITHSIQAHHLEANALKISNMSEEITDLFGTWNGAVEDVGTLSGKTETVAQKVATFEAVEKQVMSHDDVLTTITNSLKFAEGELELKTQSGGDSTSVALTSTKLAFRSGNAEVASISNEKLDIENAEVHGTLAFGGFAFIPRSNGNLSLKWIGA